MNLIMMTEIQPHVAGVEIEAEAAKTGREDPQEEVEKPVLLDRLAAVHAGKTLDQGLLIDLPGNVNLGITAQELFLRRDALPRCGKTLPMKLIRIFQNSVLNSAWNTIKQNTALMNKPKRPLTGRQVISDTVLREKIGIKLAETEDRTKKIVHQGRAREKHNRESQFRRHQLRTHKKLPEKRKAAFPDF